MTPRIALLAVALVVFGITPRPTSSADQVVLGKVFLVANPDPGDPAKRRIKVVGREPSGSTTIVGNPMLSGATLFVVADDGVSPPAAGTYFVMPAVAWSATASGYRYGDPAGAQGAVRSAYFSDNGRVVRLKAMIKPNAPFFLFPLPPAPGTEGGATLFINGGDAYCVRFGGAAGGTVRNAPAGSGTRLFKVTNPTAEAGCIHCSDQGGGMCGGACGEQQFCANFGVGCQCHFFTTFTVTSTSSTSTTSSTLSSPSPAFVDR